MKLMAAVIGLGKTDKLCQFAVKQSANEAAKIGLVDKVVSSEDELMKSSAALMGINFLTFRTASKATGLR